MGEYIVLFQPLQKIPNRRIVKFLFNLITDYDLRTAIHSFRVEKIAVRIASSLGFSTAMLQQTSEAAILHDVGKIKIPKNILNKPGKLTDAEWTLIKKHPRFGAEIIKKIEEVNDIAEIVLYHHERYDGSGYPYGKCGNSIPIISRIISIADTFEAVTADRLYRKAMDEVAAVNVIKSGQGTQFDPLLTDIFLQIYKLNKQIDEEIILTGR